MHRGAARFELRSSKSTVVTELGGSQKPTHTSESGISSKCASQAREAVMAEDARRAIRPEAAIGSSLPLMAVAREELV